MTMLRSLEIAGYGKDPKNWPVSPKLLNEDALRQWRENIATSGTQADKERYLHAISDLK